MKAVKLIKIKEGSWRDKFLALWAKVCGTRKIQGFTTFNHSIWIRPDRTDDKQLLAHELMHIKQIDDLGIVEFTYKYVKELIKVGYYDNKYEVQARKADWAYLTKMHYELVY